MAFTEKDKIVFLKKGKEAEQEFASLFKNALATSEREDIIDHVDIKISVGVDVKSLKKVKREDQQVNEHYHWIEIKGITGHAGWLYGGTADFFAFELKDYWIVVSKEDLKGLIANRCSDKTWVNKPELYKLYRRVGRKDIITLVTSYDLCYISTCIIKK